MKYLSLFIISCISLQMTYGQNSFNSTDAILGTQGYIGNSLNFPGWGEGHFIRAESIGNADNGRTRLRMYLTDDWAYDQGFEIIAHRWDGLERTLFYLPGDGTAAQFFGGASFGSSVKIQGGSDLLLEAPAGRPWDAGDIVFTRNSGQEFARIWTNSEDIGNSIYFSTSNSPNAAMTLFNGNLGIGTTRPQETLSVNGNIRSKKVTVTQTGWPDYVFDSSYQLPSLDSVSTFIQTNKHLPDMPSAATVEKDGHDLGEVQKQLLKKVEEMTLYIIQLKTENEALQLRIKNVEQKMKEQ